MLRLNPRFRQAEFAVLEKNELKPWLKAQWCIPPKQSGEFVWHSHEHEDELFYVVSGSFQMQFRDRTVELREGDMLVVPRGVEHRPVSNEEVAVMLFEPAATLNTGNAGGDKTVVKPEWI